MTKDDRAEKFKLMGENILKNRNPDTMEGFLKEPESLKKPQIHNYTNPHLHKSTSTDLARLHIQIRQHLVDRLVDEVFKRKRDPNISHRDATQRAIIEEALELFFSDAKQPKG